MGWLHLFIGLPFEVLLNRDCCRGPLMIYAHVILFGTLFGVVLLFDGFPCLNGFVLRDFIRASIFPYVALRGRLVYDFIVLALPGVGVLVVYVGCIEMYFCWSLWL